MNEMRTVRGMRDLMGPEIRVRDYLISTAIDVFQKFGYEPLDSPAVELWEALATKGGDEIESEIYKFKDKGNRDLGLRFDLTVPLARIVASNPHLPKPFKRYAVGKTWRYDRPQAGRYREFTQADVDIVGARSPTADAEVVLVALEFLRIVLGKEYVLRINSRNILKGMIEKAGVPENLSYECFRAIDKLDKIGREGVEEELKVRGIGEKASNFLLDAIGIQGFGMDVLNQFSNVLEGSETGDQGIEELTTMAEIFIESGVDTLVKFDMSLARGLDYYTGPVFEIAYEGKPQLGSLGGGGRYDQLIEKFGGLPTPATGISIGIARMVELMIAKGLGEELTPQLDVYLAPINPGLIKYAMKIRTQLIKAGISSDVDLMERPLRKLLEQADSKNAKLAVIIGDRDLSKGEISIRDMKTKKTAQIKTEDVTKYVLDYLKSS